MDRNKYMIIDGCMHVQLCTSSCRYNQADDNDDEHDDVYDHDNDDYHDVYGYILHISGRCNQE